MSSVNESQAPRFPPETTPTPTFPYRIVEQVGSGSMGVVYRAVEVALERPVAIKTLRQAVLAEESAETRLEMRQRFLQEARAAARLSHPGVTVVHRVGEEAGTPYMVMEWLDGRTLEDVLAERGRLPVGEAVHLAVALLEILEAAHHEGVVHRDVKPANIILLKDGRLKVTDFGIALIQGEKREFHTKAGVVLATPRFASPEQLRGTEVDGRSDLFSAGVLLYHMLSGEFPFVGKRFLELANAILQKEPTPISDFVSDVPPGIEAVLRRAFKKSVRERFASAAEMAGALRSFAVQPLAGEPGTQPRLQAVGREGADGEPRIFRDLPADPRRALVRLVETWPGQSLPTQKPEALLERLLDKPLHAPAFAGAVVIDGTCLFLEDGILLGAVDTTTGESGDPVAERLPREAAATLHARPAAWPEGTMALLATVLNPPRRRQSDLDSTIINLPALARKLADEKLDGLLRLHRDSLHRDSDWGLVFFAAGEPVVSLYSEGWKDVPVEQSWIRWVADHPVTAHVEEKTVAPLASWYRHALADLELTVEVLGDGEKTGEPGQTTGPRIRELFRSPRGGTSHAVRLGIYPADRGRDLGEHGEAPACRFLSWMLRDLPSRFAERDKTSKWRYLAEWLGLVRKAWLYHDLPRPDSRESDPFDLVTADEEGKVLHVATRLARSSEKGLRDFLDRVLLAKHARVKTGDLGGAILIAPEFGDDTLMVYEETIQGSLSGSLLGLGETLTGYEGFVRIGPRRGFHLLLVEEKEDGGFEPLIPG